MRPFDRKRRAPGWSVEPGCNTYRLIKIRRPRTGDENPLTSTAGIHGEGDSAPPRRLRILLVCSRFPPAIGGAENHAYELSRALARRGHDVCVLTSDVDTVSPFSRVYPENNNPIAHPGGRGSVTACRCRGLPLVPGVSSFGVFAPGFMMLGADTREFDVIHAYSYGYSSSFLPGLSPRRSGRPFVITPLLTKEGPLLRKVYDRTFGRGLLGAADQVIALTGIEREFLLTLGVPSQRLTVVPTGIDLERLRAGKPVLNEPEPRPKRGRVIFVGRVTESKGVDVLVRAMRQVCNTMPGATLEIVGPDGGSLGSVRRLVSELSLDQSVDFLGTLSTNRVHVKIAEADVLVLPSVRGEAQGIVLLEGMALGTPVIGTSAGGIPETLGHGELGLVVPPNDPKSLGHAILSLLRSEIDVEGMRARAF
ncbi:MAG: glycosyltransferase family 4 protein, partial [Thermoplasmata archaeon]